MGKVWNGTMSWGHVIVGKRHLDTCGILMQLEKWFYVHSKLFPLMDFEQDRTRTWN